MTAHATCRSVLLIACLAAAAALLPAQNAPETPAPEAEAPEPAATNTQAMVAIRDPFWPIGYVKVDKKKIEEDKRKLEEEERKRREAEQNKELPIVWPKIDVTAVSKTPKGYMAMIRGVGFVEQGQIIKIRQQGLLYRWQITTIDDNGVSYKKLDVTRAGQ